VQSGLPPKRVQPWKTLARTRAIEIQVAYSAATARAGRRAARTWPQASAAMLGENRLGELDEHPGVLRCDIDLDAGRAARSDFCQLADRVLDLPQPASQ
jgi:predicted amidohydrolase